MRTTPYGHTNVPLAGKEFSLKPRPSTLFFMIGMHCHATRHLFSGNETTGNETIWCSKPVVAVSTFPPGVGTAVSIDVANDPIRPF